MKLIENIPPQIVQLALDEPAKCTIECPKLDKEVVKRLAKQFSHNKKKDGQWENGCSPRIGIHGVRNAWTDKGVTTDDVLEKIMKTGLKTGCQNVFGRGVYHADKASHTT